MPIKNYLSEAAGTFGIVFFGTGACVLGELYGTVNHLGVSITFGVTVTLMIYLFGKISGAHLNPAVTLAFNAGRHFPKTEVLPFIIAQLIGAILASFTLKALFPASGALGATVPNGSHLETFIWEFVMSLILMYVILFTSKGKKENGKYAAIAIGATVGLEAFLGGPISGASMNPARSIGPALAIANFQALWIYIVAPIAGMYSALFVFHLQKEKRSIPRGQ
jgi:aquaporin NIP